MARVSQFMMRKFLQALLSRENLGKVLYLEHYMKFYLDIETCQTILLQTLPTDWPLFALKSTTLVQTTCWCFLITCYVVLEILLSARLENWRHGGDSYAKQLTYKSSQFTNLFTVALCCTISVNEIAGAGLMKKNCKLETRTKILIKNSITRNLNFVVKNNSFQTSESITILKFQFDMSNFEVK